jgi:hypothetical protein
MQSDCGSSAGVLGHAEQRAVAASDVDEVVAGVEIDGYGDALVDLYCAVVLGASAQSEIVRILGMLRCLAAVFEVVVGAGQRGFSGSTIWCGLLRSVLFPVVRGLAHARGAIKWRSFASPEEGLRSG